MKKKNIAFLLVGLATPTIIFFRKKIMRNLFAPKQKQKGSGPIKADALKNYYIEKSPTNKFEIAYSVPKQVNGEILKSECILLKDRIPQYSRLVDKPIYADVSDNGVACLMFNKPNTEYETTALFFDTKGQEISYHNFPEPPNLSTFNKNDKYAAFAFEGNTDYNRAIIRIINMPQGTQYSGFSLANDLSDITFEKGNELVFYDKEQRQFRMDIHGNYREYPEEETQYFIECTPDELLESLDEISKDNIEEIFYYTGRLTGLKRLLDLPAHNFSAQSKLAYFIRRLGEYYDNLENYDQALEFYRKAMEIYPKVGTKRRYKILSDNKFNGN